MVPLTALVTALRLAVPQGLPADLSAYIESIKKAGATEDAQGEMEMVASIMLGDELLEFPKSNSGEYGNSYRPSQCLKPGLSKEELATIRSEAVNRRAILLPHLREFADTDCTGFVSTAEGWALREAFTFGVKLSVLSASEGTDRTHLCEVSHVTREAFERQLHAYQALLKAMAGIPVPFLPPLPAAFTSERALPNPALQRTRFARR